MAYRDQDKRREYHRLRMRRLRAADPERYRASARRHDRKRRHTPKRRAWTERYQSTPEWKTLNAARVRERNKRHRNHPITGPKYRAKMAARKLRRTYGPHWAKSRKLTILVGRILCKVERGEDIGEFINQVPQDLLTRRKCNMAKKSNKLTADQLYEAVGSVVREIISDKQMSPERRQKAQDTFKGVGVQQRMISQDLAVLKLSKGKAAKAKARVMGYSEKTTH